MHAKTILAVLFLVSVVVAAAIFIRALPRDAAPRAAAGISAPAREILVAAVPLAAGSLLRAEDVAWASAPSSAPHDGEIARPPTAKREAKPEIDEEARGEVSGAALRADLPAGAPILRGALVKPRDRDFLRVVLTSGSRAVSIPISMGGGLVFPGDRVDVILTQTFRGDTPASRRSVSETIAEQIRVLALDGTTGANATRTATVEVSREEAEKISVASELGKLSVTVRDGGIGRDAARGAVQASAAGKPTWAGDVSPALADIGSPAAPEPAPVRPGILVLRGVKSEMVKPQ